MSAQKTKRKQARASERNKKCSSSLVPSPQSIYVRSPAPLPWSNELILIKHWLRPKHWPAIFHNTKLFHNYSLSIPLLTFWSSLLYPCLHEFPDCHLMPAIFFSILLHILNFLKTYVAMTVKYISLPHLLCLIYFHLFNFSIAFSLFLLFYSTPMLSPPPISHLFTLSMQPSPSFIYPSLLTHPVRRHKCPKRVRKRLRRRWTHTEWGSKRGRAGCLMFNNTQ